MKCGLSTGMLTEERFQHRASVDKRGRKVRGASACWQHHVCFNSCDTRHRVPVQVKVDRNNEDLAQYYRLQEEVCCACLTPAACILGNHIIL